jgi:hypothetical protein
MKKPFAAIAVGGAAVGVVPQILTPLLPDSLPVTIVLGAIALIALVFAGPRRRHGTKRLPL